MLMRPLLFCLLLFCVGRGATGSEEAKPSEKPAKSPPCFAYAVQGFEHNEWINCWVAFWKANATCSDAKRRCYSKPLDPLLWATNLHRAAYRLLKESAPAAAAYLQAVPEDDSEGNVAYLRWDDGYWFVTASSQRPNDRVYAQLKSTKKRPASSARWEVYNGSAMVKNNVTVTCVDGTYWLKLGNAAVLGGPYMLGFLVVLWFIFLCLPSREADSPPEGTDTPAEEKKEQ
eukprot:EG_transcript_21316